MVNRDRCKDSGFGLIEVMIYLALSLVVLGSVYQLLESNRSAYAGGENRMNVQQNARVGMDEIVRELRMAGYYPENFDVTAGNEIALTPIQIATDNALAITADADGTGSSSVFMFCRDGSVVRRGKGTSGVLASYNCSTGEVLASDVTNLRFVYYDANNVPIPSTPTVPYQLDSQSPGAVPSFATLTERNAIRRVVIMLSIRKDVPRQAPMIYTLTSDVRLRNVN